MRGESFLRELKKCYLQTVPSPVILPPSPSAYTDHLIKGRIADQGIPAGSSWRGLRDQLALGLHSGGKAAGGLGGAAPPAYLDICSAAPYS